VGKLFQRTGIVIERHPPGAYTFRVDPMILCPVPHGLVIPAWLACEIDIDARNSIDPLNQPTEQSITGRTVGTGEKQHAITRIKAIGLF
jgi:hypothetical protein